MRVRELIERLAQEDPEAEVEIRSTNCEVDDALVMYGSGFVVERENSWSVRLVI